MYNCTLWITLSNVPLFKYIVIYLFNQWWTFDSSLELLWIVLLCALCTCVSGTYSCFFASSMPRNNVARVQLDTSVQFSSVQFNCSVMSDSLWPHELQHARPPCPLPTARVYSNSCPLSRWCHPTISSSVVPFSSRPQSFPASGSFQMSQLFTPGGKVLEFQLQHQSFQWIFRTNFL